MQVLHYLTVLRTKCLVSILLFTMLKQLSIAIAVIAVTIWYIFHPIIEEPIEIPELDTNRYWGRDPTPVKEDWSIRPFEIVFDDTMISDLRERLKDRRPLTRPLKGIQSEYGINTDYLENVLDYWANGYDFKKRADLLNLYNHYKIKIQGLDIHFIWEKPVVSDGVQVLPLLMLHGWPSSSKEFDKIIPLLTTKREGFDFVFEVIAADLPGFGFSEGSTKPGLNPVQMGIIMRNLMHTIGHKQFYIQAGDWGSQVATQMATLFQREILGFHSNMPLSSMRKSYLKLLLGAVFPLFLGEDEHLHRIYPLSKLIKYILMEGGYFHLQATKPDTIGVALSDSPAGLAAYLIEKMAICTNRDQLDTPHGGIAALPIDDVLDTVTIVWINNCIVTSSRLYAEGFGHRSNEIDLMHRIPTFVPTAAIKFKYEVLYQPDSVLKDKFRNLVHSTTLEFGGHFAAMQTPDLLADDVFESVAAFIKFHEERGDKDICEEQF